MINLSTLSAQCSVLGHAAAPSGNQTGTSVLTFALRTARCAMTQIGSLSDLVSKPHWTYGDFSPRIAALQVPP